MSNIYNKMKSVMQPTALSPISSQCWRNRLSLWNAWLTLVIWSSQNDYFLTANCALSCFFWTIWKTIVIWNLISDAHYLGRFPCIFCIKSAFNLQLIAFSEHHRRYTEIMAQDVWKFNGKWLFFLLIDSCSKM